MDSSHGELRAKILFVIEFFTMNLPLRNVDGKNLNLLELLSSTLIPLETKIFLFCSNIAELFISICYELSTCLFGFCPPKSLDSKEPMQRMCSKGMNYVTLTKNDVYWSKWRHLLFGISFRVNFLWPSFKCVCIRVLLIVYRNTSGVKNEICSLNCENVCVYIMRCGTKDQMRKKISFYSNCFRRHFSSHSLFRCDVQLQSI